MIDLAVLKARLDFNRRAGLGSTTFSKYCRHHAIDYTLASGFCGQQAVLPIVDCGNGRFDFLEHGETFLAYVCEAYGRDGETVDDLVAWPLDRPDHVMSMFGRAALLGMWQACSPYNYTFGKPLTMHRTPLDWLRAECQGAAVVTPHLAARLLPDLPGPVAARDRAHGRQLARMVDAANRANILVPTIGRAAA